MNEPSYHLEGIVRTRSEEMEDFNGPLDVILLLLSKNKIEIEDVSITAILEQYLAYLDEMKRLDMEIASEFITMASHLMVIKTKMLLSASEQAEAESEMELLRQSLVERQRKEILEQIADIAREHELIIFSDEIYDRLVMDGYKHTSIASLAPDVFCVTFSGLSKSHMIAGFRIGWMILSGAKNKAKGYIEGINMLSSMRLCSNVPAQSVVQTALWGNQSVNDYLVPGGRIYEQREYIYKALTDIPGITAVKPQAAFYMFPKIDVKKFNIVNDEKFALDLLQDKKILIVQGSGFNWKQPDHFRVVYLPRIEVLKEAVGKISDFLSYYRQG